ncbi:hypothetical protein BD414DRAFT_499341 [Trametes punicea]|nr:hypothetical protein BD414DRAFT_499341 [Trametes punicea]
MPALHVCGGSAGLVLLMRGSKLGGLAERALSSVLDGVHNLGVPLLFSFQDFRILRLFSDNGVTAVIRRMIGVPLPAGDRNRHRQSIGGFGRWTATGRFCMRFEAYTEVTERGIRGLVVPANQAVLLRWRVMSLPFGKARRLRAHRLLAYFHPVFGYHVGESGETVECKRRMIEGALG